MASFINTNMASLNTQNNLTKSQAALNTSIQRLSSGMRVNSAKDDAAGYAIANRMDSIIRGQNVAIRNANDAISFSQTAEGALSKISDNLQRMRELAVQSANGTNGSDDRTSLDTEFKQLQAEVTRIVGNTKFNGAAVLGDGMQADGTTANTNRTTTANGTTASTFDVKFQIGAGTTSGDSVTVNSKDLSYSSSDTFKAADTSSTLSTGTTPAADGINILDQTNSSAAIAQIDSALKEVRSETIKHGANQNRFSAVIDTLQVSVENQTTARSRIMDTDYALETATMARGQILQQAGMAMLAQANQLPNGVMALMKG
jgi:flagellin